MKELFGGDGVKPYAENDSENGGVCLRKARRKRRNLLLIELLYEYAKNSTLHGLRYIVEKGLHLIERGFWFLTFLMSLAMCFYLITNVYMKWKNSPVIVSFSEKFVPVGDVPFPSITICPQMKTKASVYNFSKEYSDYENSSETEALSINRWHKLSNLGTVCGELTYIEIERNVTNSTLVEHIIEVAPDVDDVFSHCQWRGELIDCGDAFKNVLTKEGLCFTFNALASSEILRKENLQKQYEYLYTTTNSTDWSTTGGYTDFRDEETYPRRGGENRDDPDLRVFLQESPAERDGLCNVFKSGYTIFVQHPMDLPQSSLYYYAAIPGQMSSLALKFSVLTTADSLKSYSPATRQCYFPEDRKLRYFRIYTSNNCRLECQSNHTFKLCGCVWFHMPHTDSQQICTHEKLECVQTALEQLSTAEIKEVEKVTPCQCLPLCDSVQYDAEILKTNLDMQAWFNYLEKQYNFTMEEYTSKKYSQIEVYFKEPRFISMRRSELFGVTDFLANCGGLLGLFLGFSFLSLVEIFYFGTLRFYYRLRKESRKEENKTNLNDAKQQ